MTTDKFPENQNFQNFDDVAGKLSQVLIARFSEVKSNDQVD